MGSSIRSCLVKARRHQGKEGTSVVLTDVINLPSSEIREVQACLHSISHPRDKAFTTADGQYRVENSRIFAVIDLLEVEVSDRSKLSIEPTDTGYLISVDNKTECPDEGEIIGRLQTTFRMICTDPLDYMIVYGVD